MRILNPRKKTWYGLFIIAVICFYIVQVTAKGLGVSIEDRALQLSTYNEKLRINMTSKAEDSLVSAQESQQLLKSIETKLGNYLYDIPDCSFLNPLSTYFETTPELLNQIPSTVPLHNGDYYLSSRYGYRRHPISKTIKKHNGIDFASSKNTPVYASAKGIVIEIQLGTTGYGNKIVIKHRFGFQTLYGHLNKIIVSEGETIEQHQLIGTVGNTGTSTGFHLHYEILKNGIKVDPVPSLNLKRKVYTALLKIEQHN